MNWSSGLLIGFGVIAGLYGIWCGVSYYTRASVEKLGYEIVTKIQGKKYNSAV
jgi:uncharacterized protein YdgA (DUF945 family)